MSKDKSTLLRNKKPLIYSILTTAIVFLILLGFYGIHQHYKRASSDYYFTTLVPLTEAYYREQAASLGIKTLSNDIMKTCFQHTDVGGGPAGGSLELWCGIFIDRTIEVKPDTKYIKDLLENLDPTIRQEGFHIAIPAGTNLDYDAVVYDAWTASQLWNYYPGCHVSFVYTPNGDTPHAKATPNLLKYRLSCASPSAHTVSGFTYSTEKDLY